MFDIEVKRASQPVARLILAHGAGAGKEHDFMQQMAERLTALQIEVVLFNFPYMQTIKHTGKRRPPDKSEKLLSHFDSVIAQTKATADELPTFIGGKSMGGRMASMLLANPSDGSSRVLGAIALGYPFHPPGKPEKTRTAHLVELDKPMLIIQGERDTFGTQSEVEGYTLSDTIECAFLVDGDHSFKPRKASGKTHDEHITHAAELAAAFINRHRQ